MPSDSYKWIVSWVKTFRAAYDSLLAGLGVTYQSLVESPEQAGMIIYMELTDAKLCSRVGGFV